MNRGQISNTYFRWTSRAKSSSHSHLDTGRSCSHWQEFAQKPKSICRKKSPWVHGQMREQIICNATYHTKQTL